ncbi:MAG: FG-GAP-like repeat-containing protein [Desulfobulbaceae bacterium]
MDASASLPRSTQTRSLAEFLRELQCSLLLAEGQGGYLAVLGADRNGLIRHQAHLSGTVAAAGQEETVVAWGQRRLEMLSRGQLLSGRGLGLLGRMLMFRAWTGRESQGDLVDLQWGRSGLWGVGASCFGLLGSSGRYTTISQVADLDRDEFLSGLAMRDGQPAFLTSRGGNRGRIIEAESGEAVLVELDSPCSPLLIDSALYFLESRKGQVVRHDLVDGARTMVRLPGQADRMIRFGDHLLISLASPRAELCCLDLGSNNLTVLNGRLADAPTRLLTAIAGTPNRIRRMTAARAASVAVAAAGLAMALPHTARGAEEIVFTPVTVPLGSVQTFNLSTPAFADIDGDGDLDVFVGDYYGAVKYYKNSGSRFKTVLDEQTGAANPLDGVDVGLLSAPTFVDIDDDGDFDAFIGERDGTVKYYENTGSKTAPTFSERTGAANPLDGVDVGTLSAPTFVDIDGDSDLDAFIGEMYSVKYFENTGSRNTPNMVERTGAANPLDGAATVEPQYFGPAFTDIDGDGDFDVFLGEISGTVKYYENTGSKAAPTFVERTGGANPLNGVAVQATLYAPSLARPALADIDGDGDIDAFVGDYFGSILAVRNNGTAITPSFAIWTDPTIPLGGVDVGTLSAPTFVDIDGDGDLDAFIGEQYSVKYFENIGSRNTPKLVERTGAANPLDGAAAVIYQYFGPAFVDIDGDGDLDVFLGELYGTVKYYENTGSKTAPTFVERTEGANPLTGTVVSYLTRPAFADIDGDGDLDVFLGEYYGTVRYYENTGSKNVPAFVERTGAANPFDGVAVGMYSNPAMVDIDDDGDIDAFIGEYLGSVKYYENIGSKNVPAFAERTGAANPLGRFTVGLISAPTFADIDGDNDKDAFIGDFFGRIRFFRNGPVKFPWTMFLPAITGNKK